MATQHTLDLSSRFAAPNGKQEAPEKPRNRPRTLTGAPEIAAQDILRARHKAGTLKGTLAQIASEVTAELNASKDEAVRAPAGGVAGTTITRLLKSLGIAEQYGRQQKQVVPLSTKTARTNVEWMGVMAHTLRDVCRALVAITPTDVTSSKIAEFANATFKSDQQ